MFHQIQGGPDCEVQCIPRKKKDISSRTNDTVMFFSYHIQDTSQFRDLKIRKALHFRKYEYNPLKVGSLELRAGQ